ncbi:MAG: hypothetical protein ABJB73_03150 [Candidatus Nitrosocosmicus sp.]
MFLLILKNKINSSYRRYGGGEKHHEARTEAGSVYFIVLFFILKIG